MAAPVTKASWTARSAATIGLDMAERCDWRVKVDRDRCTSVCRQICSTFPATALILSGAVCTENLNTGVVVMKSAQDGA